jgi:acyl carrier protein
MELKKFVENFAAQFEDTDVGQFNSETRFKDIEGWSSLTGFLIITMIEEEYNISLKGDDIRNSTTINDLYELVKARS